MYRLNEFCNIIASLRKKKGWTQTLLAEKLGISPQSVSKWECGVGYPDVTLFPQIAELLDVPIGTLFGQFSQNEEENRMETPQTQKEYSREFPDCKNVKVYLGNLCRVEWIEDAVESCRVQAEGDPVFLRYFDAETDGQTLTVNIKNPCGSGTYWESYDRQGYTGENLVWIHTVRHEDEGNFAAINYLNLHAIGEVNAQGNYQVTCRVMEE